MIIIDPVSLGDVTCTRASSAPYYDRNGVLQSAPANTLRVTYNPADLYQAPYAMLDAGEVLSSGAGLVYSNVPIAETTYSSATTYAKDVLVYDPGSHNVYQSLTAGNVGKVLTDTTAWTPRGATKRWAMLDQYNNTQTTSADEIQLVFQMQGIAQGIFLGNLAGDEIRVSVVDQADGVVYQSTVSQVISNSASSFYNWAFRRIQRKSYFVALNLPPYANALVTICIRKIGGTAACGMCAIGPLLDVGLSQYGIGREIKDYSTINFNFDGTNNVVPRNFAKIMSIDVVIDNSLIDYVTDSLEALHQKPVAWIGAKELGLTCVFGRYSSFKPVVENFAESKMSLQIEGTV